MTTFQNTPETTVDEKLARIAELTTIAASAADLDDRLDAEYEIEVLQGEIEIDRELVC